MKSTALWLSSLVVALCALSWIVLALMVQRLDDLLSIAHPSWQPIDWAMVVGPVMIMSLFSCVLFFMVLMLYRVWMNELEEHRMKLAPSPAPPPPPTKPRRRKRYGSMNPWPGIEDDE